MAQFDPPLTEAEIHTAFVGRFRSVTVLDPGGQGSVFRCELAEGAPTALKVYVPDPDAQVEERTDREVAALRAIDCECVVKLLDHGVVQVRGGDCRFVTTEFVDGTTLKERLRAGPDLTLACRVGRDVAAAIGAMWNPGRVVHRDIKPANIMITSTDRSVLIDLGIARHTVLADLTATGISWGTPGYMSPEQASAYKQISCKSDVFALGVVLLYCLLGSHPTAGNQHVLIRARLSASTLVPSAPVNLTTFIDLMVDPSPSRRPMPDVVASFFHALC